MAETIKEEVPKEEGETSTGSSSPEEAVDLGRDRAELSAEVVSRFEESHDCAALLYAPIAEKLTFRRTRFYRFSYEGSEAKLESFIEDTLLDPVSQDLVLGGKPALGDRLFYLDYGMKKGVLDLEKETILRYYRELDESDFAIQGLELSTRIYVFGKDGGSALAEVFVRDIVNPAIHRWDVHEH